MANQDFITEEQLELLEQSGLISKPTNPIVPGKSAPSLPFMDGAGSTAPFFAGSLPPQFQLDSSFSRAQALTSRVPKNTLMPLAINSNPSSNAAIQSTAVKIIESGGVSPELQTNSVTNPVQNKLNLIQGPNILLAADSSGGVKISGTAGGDGLTHGDPIWEYDSAYVSLRDDFLTFSTGFSNATFGQLNWFLTNSTNVLQIETEGGAPPNMGQVAMENDGTTKDFAALVISGNANSSGTSFSGNAWALLENPGWKMTWVFQVNGSVSAGGGGAFNSTKKAFYAGLTGANWRNLQTGGNSGGAPRPDVFIGVRYDTSVTPGALTLSSVATSSGGVAVYTGTITGGGNGSYIGLTFVVTGFLTGANNGTFVCTQSTTTTLTLQNASAVAETHAATATGPTGLNDTFFTFEVVNNQAYSVAARHNLQGQTFVTNITPTKGTWYRLEIVCSAVGQVTLSLNGTNSTTFTVPKQTIVSTSSGQVSVTNEMARFSVSVGTNGQNGFPPFGAGSSVVISGLTGGNAALNGTWTLQAVDPTDDWFIASGVSNIANNSTAFTVVGYAAYTPFIAYGNDDAASNPTANTFRIAIDFFSFVWNPNLGPNAPGTPDATKARYW